MKEAWRYTQSKAGGTGHLHSHHWGEQLLCVGNLSNLLFFSPPLQVNPLLSSELREIPSGRSTSSSCDGQGSPYLGEGFEPQRCDNCPRGCAHIGCPQLAERAEVTPVSQALPTPVAPPKKGTVHPSKAPGYLGSSLSSTINTESPNGVHLSLHQVPIVPSHSSLLFKASLWCFGVSREPG